MALSFIMKINWNEVFSYDKSTGILYWKISPSHNKVIGSAAGGISPEGYYRVRYKYTMYSSHRIIWEMFNNTIEKGLQIDHINGIRSDNRLENLRVVTHLDNSKNQRLDKRNNSGVVGVSWHKRAKKYQARIGDKHLGYYKKLSEAIEVRKLADISNNYHENHGVTL